MLFFFTVQCTPSVHMDTPLYNNGEGREITISGSLIDFKESERVDYQYNIVIDFIDQL